MTAFEKAIQVVGSQAELAQILGVSPMAVSQWKKRGVPAERCFDIEQATSGKVTCRDLRPDVFRTGAAA